MGIAPTGVTAQEQLSLQRCSSLYLIRDTPKGRGVFASNDIPAGTIVETCPVLVLDSRENKEHVAKTSLYHYTYNWPAQDPSSSGRTVLTQAVIFGLGSLFNHSSLRQNVGWQRDLERQVVIYRALRDILAGEELCISYGDRLTFVDADSPQPVSDEETEDMILQIET